MRMLEWFSGLGGAGASLRPEDEVVAGIDHDQAAEQVYQSWWPHPTLRRNISSLKARAVPAADLWWMSPPCQPYTIRGNQKDLEDRRSAAFLRVLELLDELQPERVALENVPWFAGSQAHQLLADWLDAKGYDRWEGELCPTAAGVPMVRRRFFLAASRVGAVQEPEFTPETRPLAAFLDPVPAEDTAIADDVLARFADALHLVDADDSAAIAACFTGAYGLSPVYAGSYLRQGDHLRLFSPDEVVRLLGFPAHCRLPDEISRKKRYKLAGNSVSVHCARAVIDALR